MTQDTTQSLFNFEYQDYMVPQSVEIPTSLDAYQNDTPLEMLISDEQQTILGVDDDSYVLVFLTDHEVSTAFTSPISSADANSLTWQLPQEQILSTGFALGSKVTAWMTPYDKQKNRVKTFENYPVENHRQTAHRDPSGGSWLRVDHRTLTHKEDSGVSGRINFGAPFTGILTLNGGETVTFRFELDDTTIVKNQSLLSSFGDGLNIRKGDLDELGATKDNRTVTTWIHTKSITHSAEQAPTTTGSSIETTASLNTNGTDANSEKTNTSPKPVSTGRPTAEKTNSVSSNTPDKNKNETNSTNTETPTPQSSQQNQSNQHASSDTAFLPDETPEFEVTKKSELVPVVLLDDDERLQEDWTGHYKTSDGTLVCGKEYTDAVEDRGRKHYTEVCEECAAKRPGEIPIGDLSELLSKKLGIRFTDETPFTIDHTDAAELLYKINSLTCSNNSD